jgi:hypothetical protein
VTKAIRLVIPVVIAVVLGPLIAGLAVCLLALGNNFIDRSSALPLGDLFAMFGVYIVFAYFIGGVIALIAGLLVSIWMIWREPNAFVTIGAAVIATVGYMAIGALGFLGPAEWTNARSNFLFTLALAVIAAAACWFLTRRFLRSA